MDHNLYVFDSLVLEHAAFPGGLPGDYERDAKTEQVFLRAGGMLLGRAFYDEGAMPTATSGTNGRVHVFMTLGDPLGSTSFVIDHDTSELVERTTYLTYGGIDSDYRPSRWESFREDIRYTGHWDDSQVGLTYFGARYYSPALARFISPDPLTIHGLGGDPNPYAYVGGSPAGNVDPFGLDVNSAPPPPVVNLPPSVEVVAPTGRPSPPPAPEALPAPEAPPAPGSPPAPEGGPATQGGGQGPGASGCGNCGHNGSDIPGASPPPSIGGGSYVKYTPAAPGPVGRAIGAQVSLTQRGVQLVGGLGLAVAGAAGMAAGAVGGFFSATALPVTGGASAAGVAVSGALIAVSASGVAIGLHMMQQAASGGGGRGSNKLAPDADAEGAHSTFKTDPQGKVTKYAEWKENSQNPSRFDEVKRVDVKGGSHFDKATGQDIPTPHVHEGGTVRPALPEEVP